tara:strand:+ start:445 stop:2391 length:1947 start_codon:yes stop_codon:yes gene_type:complete
MILNNHLYLSRCFFWQYLGEVMNKQTNTLRRASVLGLALTCATAGLRAEEIAADATTSQDLVPYVVVATRTPISLDQASPSVSYISEAEMQQNQDRSVVDALMRQPGLAVIASGAAGAQTSLFTRGTESNHTAFFLDGRRLNPGFANQYDLETLSIGNLSSVQVLRGASSVNYGSSGIGGVVDLRSRSGFDAEGSSTSIETEIGSNNYRRGAVDVTASTDRLGVSLSGTIQSMDNERANDAYETKGVTPRFDFKLTDTLSVELLGQYIKSDKELAGTTAAPTLDKEQQTTNWLVSPGLRYAKDELTVHLFYARSESKLKVATFGIEDIVEVESDEVSLQVDYSVTDDLLLTFGSVYRNDEASDSNIAFFGPAVPYEEGFEQTGVFGQAVWRLTDSIELRGGLRNDTYTDFGNQTTGNLEAIYLLSELNLTLFAKAATSYAPPGVADIAFDAEVAGTPLQPEESESYEVGFRHEALEGDLRWSVLYFRNNIDEMLDFSFNPMTFVFDTFNVKQATTEGVEFAATYALCEKLDLAAAYTYLTATDDDTDTRLARRPRHTVQLSASYSFTEALSAGILGVGHFDREDIDPVTFDPIDHEDFFVVRLVADWEIDAHWTVFARVENLLDESYAPAAGFPALGRTGYIGARFAF